MSGGWSVGLNKTQWQKYSVSDIEHSSWNHRVAERFPGKKYYLLCLSLSSSLVCHCPELSSGLGWLLGLDREDCPDLQDSSDRGTQRASGQEAALASRFNYEGSFEILLRGHRDIALVPMGSRSELYAHKRSGAYVFCFPPCYCSHSPALLLNTLLPAVSTSCFSGLSVSVWRHSRKQLAVGLRKLPKNCSLPWETQVALSESFSIPDDTPFAGTLLTHVSSQLHNIPVRENSGREWAWGNIYTAIKVNYSKTILYLKGYSDILLRVGCLEFFNKTTY